MRIGPLGVREIVALGLLVVAVVGGVSVTLLRPDDRSQANAVQERIDQKTAAANPDGDRSPAATATASATSLPAKEVAQPNGWLIKYESLATSGGFTPEGQYSVEKLDLAFPNAPFPDMHDDKWRTVVAGELESDREGPWTFRLEYQGDVKVYVAEALVAEGSATSPTTLEVTAPSKYTTTSIRIEAQDTGGPFVLRWK